PTAAQVEGSSGHGHSRSQQKKPHCGGMNWRFEVEFVHHAQTSRILYRGYKNRAAGFLVLRPPHQCARAAHEVVRIISASTSAGRAVQSAVTVKTPTARGVYSVRVASRRSRGALGRVGFVPFFPLANGTTRPQRSRRRALSSFQRRRDQNLGRL